MKNDWIDRLPKVELHCHLDGSIRPQRMTDYLRSVGEPVPADLENQIFAGEECESLTAYLRCFALPVRLLQTEAGLERAVIDLLEDARRDNIRYLEIRFAPNLHLAGGLTYDRVFQAVERGRRAGMAATGVYCRFIACGLRTDSEEHNLTMLEAAKDWFPRLFCAADLAGDENGHPMEESKRYFQQVNRLGIPFTVHAGETGVRENVRLALDYGAARIGHGIAMSGDRALQRRCREAGVGIELCPTSNFQTRAARSWAGYPIREYLDAGVPVTLNTDNRTVSRTTLTREYRRAVEEGGCTREDAIALVRGGVAMSFAPETVKAAILRELDGMEQSD
ncbi:MAG: adenosine deaminase [Clostridiales bacterium]|nr:adenosine deaminase [Clostridiales bacterium]